MERERLKQLIEINTACGARAILTAAGFQPASMAAVDAKAAWRAGCSQDWLFECIRTEDEKGFP
jgi:hypothetical protein